MGTLNSLFVLPIKFRAGHNANATVNAPVLKATPISGHFVSGDGDPSRVESSRVGRVQHFAAHLNCFRCILLSASDFIFRLRSEVCNDSLLSFSHRMRSRHGASHDLELIKATLHSLFVHLLLLDLTFFPTHSLIRCCFPIFALPSCQLCRRACS